MADESTQSEVTETASPTGDTGATGTQNATTPVAASDAAAERVQVANESLPTDEDAAEAAWHAKRGAAAPVTPKSVTAKARPDEQETPADGLDAETPPAFSPEESAIVKRYGLEPGDIPPMSEAARTKFIRNLEQRAAHHDALQNQLRTNPAQQPPLQGQSQNQASAQQNQPDDPWESAKTFYGEEGIAPLRTAFDRSVERAVAPSNQLSQQLAIRLINEDVERSIKELELPEGIDRDDPEIRKQLVEAAKGFFGPNGELFDLAANNFMHAMPKAAASIFNKQMLAAQAKAKTERTKKALLGSPSRGSQPPTSRAPLTEEDRENAWLKEHQTA